MPYKSQSQRAWMHIHHPKMARRWDAHTPKGKKLPKHVSDSMETDEELELALLGGPAAVAELLTLRETGRQGSSAMLLVAGDPPGKHTCKFLRDLVRGRTSVIVVGTGGRLPAGALEQLLQVSMPDCASKLRVLDHQPSAQGAIEAAMKEGMHLPNEALEVFCSPEQAAELRRSFELGNARVDPGLIRIRTGRVPTDDGDGIIDAIDRQDADRMESLLDPHVFSDDMGLERYRRVLSGQGMLREFGTGAPGSGAAGPATMRGSNSSSWSNGRGALKAPQNHVPEDENERDADRALDWGPGRITGASI